MRIAFYAPLKPPDHPLASGDRTMARLLIAALRRAGHGVTLASRLRSFDAAGDARRQQRLQAIGDQLAERLVRRFQAAPPNERPELWFTYHLYHKAPDWLGPRGADALGIPYVAAEASFAGKQEGGRWALGHAAAAGAIRRADLIVELNPADREGIVRLRGPRALRLSLAPFIDAAAFVRARQNRPRHRARLARRLRLPADVPWLLAVAMMRPGVKLASYRLLARALAPLRGRRWRLLVVGEGPARAGVVRALAPLGPRARLLGGLAAAAMPAVLAAGDLLVWPAIGEAWGMVLLEAQAAGLPVVAGRSDGTANVVAHGKTGMLAAEGDAAALTRAVAALLDRPARRGRLGHTALARVRARHDLPGAAAVLDRALQRVARQGSGVE